MSKPKSLSEMSPEELAELHALSRELGHLDDWMVREFTPNAFEDDDIEPRP